MSPWVLRKRGIIIGHGCVCFHKYFGKFPLGASNFMVRHRHISSPLPPLFSNLRPPVSNYRISLWNPNRSGLRTGSPSSLLRPTLLRCIKTGNRTEIKKKKTNKEQETRNKKHRSARWLQTCFVSTLIIVQARFIACSTLPGVEEIRAWTNPQKIRTYSFGNTIYSRWGRVFCPLFFLV